MLQIPNKSNFNKEGFGGAHGLRVQSVMVGNARHQEFEAADPTVTVNSCSQEAEKYKCSSFLILFIQTGTSAHGTVPITFRTGLLIAMNTIRRSLIETAKALSPGRF